MEIQDDIFIIPAETSAHFWMDRFIEQYKYGIDESVTVKNGKIKWTGDWCEHSIYLNKDRFIIDGNEVYINAELWNKYLKIRELCGAIYVRAPRKIAFPYDWSELSDEQVMENIQYLQKNYKKYEISVVDESHVNIDNITISRGIKKVEGREKTCFTINNKTYCRETSIGKELIDLTHLCKLYAVPFKDKVKRFFKDNKDLMRVCVLGGGAIIIVFTTACFMVINAAEDARKSKEKSYQKLKQEVSNDVLYSLKKEQQKTINYNDSVKVR